MVGGLLAGLVTTRFVVPALYSLVVRDRPAPKEDEEEGTGHGEGQPADRQRAGEGHAAM